MQYGVNIKVDWDTLARLKELARAENKTVAGYLRDLVISLQGADPPASSVIARRLHEIELYLATIAGMVAGSTEVGPKPKLSKKHQGEDDVA